ncbi:hypothetical protein JTE90_012172, partial [Oedothorax gibbosus]
CSPWGTCRKGTDRPKITLLPRFSRPKRRPGHRKTGGFLREQGPYLRRPIPGKELLQEKIIFPRVPVDSPSFGSLPHWGPKDLSPCRGLGKINPSLLVAREKHEHVFCVFGQTSASERVSSDPLDRLTHFQLLSQKPFSSFSPQGLPLSFLHFYPKISPGRLPRAHARDLKRTPPRPSYSLRLNLHRALPYGPG